MILKGIQFTYYVQKANNINVKIILSNIFICRERAVSDTPSLKRPPLSNSHAISFANLEQLKKETTRRRPRSNSIASRESKESDSRYDYLRTRSISSPMVYDPHSFSDDINDVLVGNNGDAIFERTSGKMGKGMLCLEYSDHGTGDFRTPSFMLSDTSNGSTITPLRYCTHTIYSGKIPIPGHMHSIRSTISDSSTLVVTLQDMHSGVEVDLIYTAMHDYDCITRRAVYRNMDESGSAKIINKACSVTIDFESDPSCFYLTQLSGSWGRERYIEENRLSTGMRSFGSTRGVSSHQHNPFAVISTGPPSETKVSIAIFCYFKKYTFIYLLNETLGRGQRILSDI